MLSNSETFSVNDGKAILRYSNCGNCDFPDSAASKYAYNATYSMQLIKDNEYVSAANELNINKYLNEQGYPKQALVNCRRYVGIDKCGDTVFLKYYDDIWYNKAQE